MAKKSTKTAHVLNLISKAAPETQESAKNMNDMISKPEQPADSPIHSSLTQNTKNEEISNQIKDSLLQELGLQDNTEDQAQTDSITTTDTPATDQTVSEDTPVTDLPIADQTALKDMPATDESIDDDHMISESSNSKSFSETEHTSKIDNRTSEISLDDQIAESLSEELTEEIQTTFIQPVPPTTPIEDVLVDFSAEPTSSEIKQQDTSEIKQQDTSEIRQQDTSEIRQQDTSEIVQQPISEEPSIQAESPILPSAAINTTSSAANSETTNAPTAEFRYINIYEELVKEQLAEYMARFHVCTCNRCKMDTMALTLSNLPSKYAVIDANLQAPFLNYCSIKLGVEIMTELTKACLVVASHPRHAQTDVESNKE